MMLDLRAVGFNTARRNRIVEGKFKQLIRNTFIHYLDIPFL